MAGVGHRFEIMGVCGLLTALLLLPEIPAFSQATPDNEAEALLVVPSIAVMAKVGIPEGAKALVQSYINSQLALYGLTLSQLEGLPIEMQRKVLSPGRGYALSREWRHSIIYGKKEVPEPISQQLVKHNVIDPDLVTRYGIELPPSIQAMLKTPRQYHHVLIGSRLLLLAPDYSIADMQTNVY